LAAGAIWMRVYDAVTTQAGRYVQGGGCATVGVAGLVQSGGFGSFSKNFGTAAAGLVEAEIVTADGAVRIANACTNPDLFWGLKGGGGGSLGVVTRVTLRTYPLPDWFGGAFLTVKASSADAFSRLVSRFVAFYAERLWSPHWGESVAFRRDYTFTTTMVWQGLEQTQAEAAWRPFLDWLAAAPQDFTIVAAPRIVAVPARHWWDAAYLREHVAGAVTGNAAGNAWWTGNQGEIGWFVHGYTSAWLPDSLLAPEQQERLAETLFAASREWTVSLHFNKGLGGAPAAAVAASRDTATNPAALTAFALAIVSASGPPAYPGMPGPPPDTTAARADAAAVTRAMAVLRRLVPETAAYVSESDFFERDWQRAFWGSNYARLRAIKAKYDPDGLFIVHHGVGSEEWSDDGFSRLAAR
jgi:FAD/FMN-containing dehydrogenase